MNWFANCETREYKLRLKTVQIIFSKTKKLNYFYRAQSGTGKTATFSISCLQMIDTQLRDTQALILSPTRELAQQIQKVDCLIIVQYKKIWL